MPALAVRDTRANIAAKKDLKWPKVSGILNVSQAPTKEGERLRRSQFCGRTEGLRVDAFLVFSWGKHDFLLAMIMVIGMPYLDTRAAARQTRITNLTSAKSWTTAQQKNETNSAEPTSTEEALLVRCTSD